MVVPHSTTGEEMELFEDELGELITKHSEAMDIEDILETMDFYINQLSEKQMAEFLVAA